MFKVGDKVVCIDDIKPFLWTEIKHYYPDFVMENKIYTIRNIYKSNVHNGMCFNLEEIICKLHEILGNEMGFRDNRFRKLEPPMEIEESIEEQKVLQEVN